MVRDEQFVQEICGEALQLAPARRGAYLDEACRDRPELRRLAGERLRAKEPARSPMALPLARHDAPRDALSRAEEVRASEPWQEQPTAAVTANLSRFRNAQVIAGRFVVVRFIARGGMGEVYEVEDRLLGGAHVAMKVILPEGAADADRSHRFEQEVLLARKVTHPNLCPIYELFRCDQPAPSFLFLTMKLLHGETLEARLRGSVPLSPAEAAEICGRLLTGVAAIHAAGVIHRDLKPNNIMIERSGDKLCVYIMDFGLARLYESESTVLRTGAVAGTPGYLAPELLNGGPPTQATDLFALGVVLHQVFTGERPTEGRRGRFATPRASLASAQSPPQFKQAIHDFLSDDPRRRCETFAQLVSRLPSHDLPITPLPGARSLPVFTRRQFAFAGAASAGALAAAAAWQHQGIYNLFHPLPMKRFVAVLNWPPLSDERVRPMLFGLIDAIADELARAEAFDRNFFVAAEKTLAPLTTSAQLNEVRESLGANLVLATSAATFGQTVQVSLHLLEPVSGRTLRSQVLQAAGTDQGLLPQRTIQAAAKLLDVSRYGGNVRRSPSGTDNPEALAAFQAAEILRKQENDTGLTQAIEMYKRALEADPRYAVAQSRLGWAYLRSYGKTEDPAALTLGRENCEAAIALDPELVEAHVGLAWVLNTTGDHKAAFREIAKALSLDPANAHTLIDQAQFYVDDGQYALAENSLKRSLKLRPNYWLPHSEYGVLLANQGRYTQALLEFRSASLLASRNALNYSNIGSVYLQLGRLDEAIQSCLTSLRLDPADGAASTLAAACRLKMKLSEAIAYAQQATAMGPAYCTNWVELGDCYTAAGRMGDALPAYQRANEAEDTELRTEPKNGPGWMLLAFCRAKLGQREGIAALIAKAEGFHADDLPSQLCRARTLALCGKQDEALAVIARCVRRGATAFQLKTMPDLESLRADPRFDQIIANQSSLVENAREAM